MLLILYPVPLKFSTVNPDIADTELSVQGIISHLPASPDHLDDYHRAQQADPQIMNYCRLEWPNQSRIKPEFMSY